MAARRSSQGGGGPQRPGSRQGRGASPRSGARGRELAECIAEAEEIVERLVADLSELDEQHRAGHEVDPDLINGIFRSAHSLKGLAGMFGLDGVGRIAHHLEDVLDGLRLGRVALEPSIVTLLEEGAALVIALLAGLEAGDASEDGEPEEISRFLDRIERTLQIAAPSTGDPLDGLELDEALRRTLTEYEEHRLRENLRRGRQLSLVQIGFGLDTFEEGLAELTAVLRERGEVVSTLPAPGATPDHALRFSLLVGSELDVTELRERLCDWEAEVVPVHRLEASPIRDSSTPPAAGASDGPASEASTPDTAGPAAMPAGVEGGPAAAPPIAEGLVPDEEGRVESLRSLGDTVRVDIAKLDELMNLVGELALQRHAIAGLAARLAAEPATARAGAELAKLHKTLDRRLKALQAGVLDVRMVPLRQVFEKLSRVVRRLRRDLDKEVELRFSGADTELDKLIVEQLIDPLVHIVRNAFDHALEPADERRAAGKPERGCLRVGALQRGHHVVIEVADDGRGLRFEAIRARAQALGLLAADEPSTPRELASLVFEPGFSTAERVSETSGRGVGMDVVRANLARLGGLVDLASEPGRGTTVTITLPITLAIIQVLVVGVGPERFALPLNSVLETLRVEPQQIGRSDAREILDLRGEPLALRRLGEVFEVPDATSSDAPFVVVLGLGEQRLGLLVDRLEGQQDAVIKPIKGPYRSLPGISGATEDVERGAILVVDVSALFGDALRRREAA